MSQTELLNFDEYDRSYKTYSGSERKYQIIIDGEYYMLKISGKSADTDNPLQAEFPYNPLSEHLGCAIFRTLDIPVQDTLLGKANNMLAVACKDFIQNDPVKKNGLWQLQEFSELENNVIDSSKRGRTPHLENIEYVFHNHELFTTIRDEAIARFWDTFVVDALISNFDRHSGNWGYIVNIYTGEIELAPVYDCSSALYPNLSDAAMSRFLNNREEIEKRVYQFPRATLMVGGKKISYQEMLNSRHPECSKALKRIFERIDIDTVCQKVASVPGISKIRMDFLIKMLEARYELLLNSAYQVLTQNIKR